MDSAAQLAAQGTLTTACLFGGYFVLTSSKRTQSRGQPRLDFPSEGSRVVEIRVASGRFIDRVQFVYSDGATVTHGGRGGTHHEPFELGPEEQIVEVRGRRGSALDAIQFVTNTGRASPTYGGDGGEPFSLESNDAVGGFVVDVSANGWISELIELVRVSSVVQPPQPEIPDQPPTGFLDYHRSRIRSSLVPISIFASCYFIFMVWAGSFVVIDCLTGPHDMSTIKTRKNSPLPHHYVSLSKVGASTKILQRGYNHGDDKVEQWLAIGIPTVIGDSTLNYFPAGLASQNENVGAGKQYFLVRELVSDIADASRAQNEVTAKLFRGESEGEGKLEEQVAGTETPTPRPHIGTIRRIDADMRDAVHLPGDLAELKYYIDTSFDRRWPFLYMSVAVIAGCYAVVRFVRMRFVRMLCVCMRTSSAVRTIACHKRQSS
jgi:hypothetical protein